MTPPTLPTCRVTAEPCRAVSRVPILFDWTAGIVQCLDCSLVYEAIGWQLRVCDHCGLEWGESLHDPCLGRIEGVTEVCCGHGNPELAYAIYADGRTEGYQSWPLPS